ncbi:L-histidine N(alpha)-methyltransferase [Elongatibacter sediminis]|uniref:L-histidine N(Alpha)-methyltransferase n=1 Tax=Elongatibacter sediminis TaxID=3119006 RepID=A0AAW9R4J7_9GAMM
MNSAARKVLLTEQSEATSGDLAEILSGLRQEQKTLPPKFFYDEHGSELFERICELPEYYPTRTELDIMERYAGDMAARTGPLASVIEFGSGASLKTRTLLEHLERPAAYVPVDISGDHLLAAARSLAQDFPDIEILPVAADFTRPFPLPDPKIPPRRNLVYFPGSTIGNFLPDAALDLLRVMHQEAGAGGALLIGVDLRKDPAVLERAYNDDRGVTAAFNRNMLYRLNREFGADFDPAAFQHRAVWNDAMGRIEMHLVSREDQTFEIGGETFTLRQDEFITTEYSHKYTQEQFRGLTEAAGFTVEQVWTDPREWFSVQFCTRD